MDDLLRIPGTVALTGAFVAYVYQLIQKRLSVKGLLEAEINLLLEDARLTDAFLARDDHYWLNESETLKTAPKAFSPNYKVFDALIKDIYILGQAHSTKVLLFYEYHEFCERLRKSLFEHVQVLKEAGQPLSAKDVQILQARLQRCRAAYKELDKAHPHCVKLRNLKSEYTKPSSQGVLIKL